MEAVEAPTGNLVFGTGGLRGIMGSGTNQINTDTIRRVTQGLANVVLAHELPKSVCVTYDTRHNSKEFAQTVCDVLSVFGISVYVFDKSMPTPALSFMIRHLKLGWGVAITASHNPQEYNGYKVYDSHGVQVTDETAMIITGAIDLVPVSGTLPEADKNLIINISPEDEAAYFRQIVSFVQKEESSVDFPIVYSALHGAGANAVPFVLNELGFFPVCIQQAPDGSFGGLKTPNPEESVVYEEAIRASEKYNAKLLLATDPDCDRVGVMVRTQHGLELISGNQIGALLIDYLAQTRGVVSGDTVITTIVSGLLGEFVSASYGFDFKRLLTGFKYIGEYAERLPDDKNFFFGYEESYGFLAGDGVRDKDAVIASALIVKMAVFYHNKGMTLIDRWGQLSEIHGYCLENLHSMEVSMEKQAEIISALREGEAFDNLIKTEDYLPGPEGLPPANVLKYYFDNNAWAAIRPSGTEPKLKVYTGVKSRTYKEAKAALELLDKKILQEIEKL